MLWLFLLALILLVLGRLSLNRSTTLRRESGLPTSRLIYADTHQDWRPNDNPLYSSTHNLTGKPDYVVETPAETSKAIIPVEVKSSPAPKTSDLQSTGGRPGRKDTSSPRGISKHHTRGRSRAGLCPPSRRQIVRLSDPGKNPSQRASLCQGSEK